MYLKYFLLFFENISFALFEKYVLFYMRNTVCKKYFLLCMRNIFLLLVRSSFCFISSRIALSIRLWGNLPHRILLMCVCNHLLRRWSLLVRNTFLLCIRCFCFCLRKTFCFVWEILFCSVLEVFAFVCGKLFALYEKYFFALYYMFLLLFAKNFLLCMRNTFLLCIRCFCFCLRKTFCFVWEILFCFVLEVFAFVRGKLFALYEK